MNTSTPQGTEEGPLYSAAQEMEALDLFPFEIRRVISEAPFDVSAASMRANAAVMRKLQEEGSNAPNWLTEQLLLTYRRKIAA